MATRLLKTRTLKIAYSSAILMCGMSLSMIIIRKCQTSYFTYLYITFIGLRAYERANKVEKRLITNVHYFFTAIPLQLMWGSRVPI